MQIFAGVREIWGVKKETGRLRCRFSYLLLAAAIISRHRLIIAATEATVRQVKLTQCCRAYTLALARLSCLPLSVNISKTVQDTAKVTIND